MPRWPEKKMDSNELELPMDREVILPADGSIHKEVAELNRIEAVHTDGVDTSYADALAFMEEKVTVMLHEDTDPNAENPVQVACNGINQFFFRGQPQDVKRKYVEILARAKRTRVATPEVTDGSGARTNAIRQSSSIRYPFQVVFDPNPKGPAWLKAVMQEPA
jgi:hypothetical protein